MSNSPKILLLQLMSNGDCLYATTVARQIKHDYPDCHLTWAIASACKAMIDNNPYIDAVWEVPGVNKGNITDVIRQIKKEIEAKKRNGEYDLVYFTQIVDDNLAHYDGSIRSSIFRGYDKPITVPVTPVLRLRPEEIAKAKEFAEKYQLANYKNVLLFEFAPQSGQLAMTPELAIDIAGKIARHESTVVIMSSYIKIGNTHNGILDGSVLTMRETAAITHYCTMLLGCSSGITWISTSDAAKPLPMLQMLDPNAFWVNPISRDFERNGFSTEQLIELYDNDLTKIAVCVDDILSNGFPAARKKYYSPLPLQFKTTSRSIYNMLCFFQFKSIVKHVQINLSVFGWQPALLNAIAKGFLTAPFKLAYNVVNKRLIKKKLIIKKT